MQNNEAVEKLYNDHHDDLINISNTIIEGLDDEFELDRAIEAEDMVQQLYLELLEQSEYMDDQPNLGYIFVVLKSKLNKIITDNCLVD
jgi:DNA-directed RNA polymerase specialized sigma24 family protein